MSQQKEHGATDPQANKELEALTYFRRGWYAHKEYVKDCRELQLGMSGYTMLGTLLLSLSAMFIITFVGLLCGHVPMHNLPAAAIVTVVFISAGLFCMNRGRKWHIKRQEEFDERWGGHNEIMQKSRNED